MSQLSSADGGRSACPQGTYHEGGEAEGTGKPARNFKKCNIMKGVGWMLTKRLTSWTEWAGETPPRTDFMQRLEGCGAACTRPAAGTSQDTEEHVCVCV